MSKKVTAVTADTPYKEIWRALFKKHVNALPVIDAKKKLVGIITKEDLLKTLYPGYEELIDDFYNVTDFEKMELKVRELSSLTAKNLMNRRVIYTRETTPMMRALSRMIVRRVNQLPVLSTKDEVIGVVTKGDIFYALFKQQMSQLPPARKSLKTT